ncbi:hypothetical protein MMC11_004613 [Xylographa trunciseda]|nr:hypothetical protein [Xylographa trunciseda]
MTRKKTKVSNAGVDKQNWMSSDRLFTSKSKLPDVELHKALSRSEAWDTLTEEEKAELRKLLPESVMTNGTPNEDFLRYSPDWREGVRVFQDEVRSGRHEREWLEEAHEARRERTAGLFDKHKDEEFEEFWGQKQKVDPRAQAGDAVKVVLSDMIKANLFNTGDVFKYSRSFGRGKNAILVEKECILLEISGEALKFYIPSGQRRFIGSSTVNDTATAHTDTKAVSTEASAATERVNDADLTLHNTRSQGKSAADTYVNSISFRKGKTFAAMRIPEADDPQAPPTMSFTSFADLERQILAVDGRAPPGVKNDPWRYIRVLHRNQDLGALWDMREQEYNRSQRRR